MDIFESYIFVTGSAGFIGSALCKELLNMGCKVIGLDNLNSYYDINLKIERLKLVEKYACSKSRNWEFIMDHEDLEN